MEIKKLADIIEWADSWIEGVKPVLIALGEFETDKDVKQLEAVKKVVSEAIERHSVYTNALNNDIADKDAKIELLEKEIEGRKEGYWALKEKYDHMTALEESWHANAQELVETCKSKNEEIEKLRRESEKWQDLAKMNRDTICNQYDVCEDFKKKIAELEEENEKLKVDLIHEREKNEKLAKDHAELENDMRKYATDIISQSGTICNLKKELDARGEEIRKLEEKVKHQRENLDGINRTLEIRIKENESLIAVRNNQEREIEAHESENARLSERIMKLKEENSRLTGQYNYTIKCHEEDIDEINRLKDENAQLSMRVTELKKGIDDWVATSKANGEENQKLKKEIEDLEGRLKEESDLVYSAEELHIDLYKKNEELEKTVERLKKENEDLKIRDEELTKQVANKLSDIDSLRKYITHWKNQERIRTDQLRATESKVEELWEEIEHLRDLGEHWKRSYFNIRYSIDKLKDESKEDDHGRKGFKRYIKWLVKEEEAKYKESWKARLNEELEAIFKEEEETEVNDIPCGEDAIE